MPTEYIAKDSWLSQIVGSSTNYGNGTNDLITVGPAPNATPGNPDIKGRGVFSVPLDTVLDGLTAVTAATVEVVVAPTTCIGTRGGTIRIFLEECTGTFSEKSVSGACSISSGSGGGVWPGPSVNIANRALHTSGAHSTGDILTFDVTAMVAARLAAGAPYGDLIFRLIPANSDASGYDETNAARRITIYAREASLQANRPRLVVTGTSGSVAKSASDTMTLADTTAASITSQGSGTVAVSDSLSLTDTLVSAAEAPLWSTVIPSGSNNGLGSVSIPSPSMETNAILSAVSVQDAVAQCKFRVDKVPDGGQAVWRLLARAIDNNNFYRLSVNMDAQQKISLLLTKVVAGVNTLLFTASDISTLIAGADYWVKFQVQGVSPTTLSAKIWRDTVTEPTSWQAVATDSEASLQAAASLGLGARITAITNAPLVFTFDNYEAIAP